MSKPIVQVRQKAIQAPPQEPHPQDQVSTFSEEQIRVRAYQIYESSDRTNKHADHDWFQAQTELMEMVGGN
jgi:hypothetical protein